MTETRTGAGLAERLHGTAVMAADADWDMARQAYNLTVDQRPEVVAFPSDADDVARAVRFARDEGMQVAAQRTGHGAAAMGSLEGTLLLNTRGLGDVEIDADARTARVGAGVRWLDLVPQASDMGLAALHGSAPDICVVGTRWAAASGSTPASWALPPTASPRSNWSTPRASRSGSTPTTSPSCSGPCAAAGATSGSSLRSSWS